MDITKENLQAIGFAFQNFGGLENPEHRDNYYKMFVVGVSNSKTPGVDITIQKGVTNPNNWFIQTLDGTQTSGERVDTLKDVVDFIIKKTITHTERSVVKQFNVLINTL